MNYLGQIISRYSPTFAALASLHAAYTVACLAGESPVAGIGCMPA
jgi:hypothetical protein